MPRANPRRVKPAASVGIFMALNKYFPSSAPIRPVITANTAAKAGMPPIFSAMPMATGAVTDFGTSKTPATRMNTSYFV